MPYVRRADADIWWEATGEGRPVVLVNGLGSPSATWFRLVRRLAPHRTVITVDNRGTGRTTCPSAPHDVPTMAADIAAVLEVAGGGRADVVGHSMGGFVAQELALDHPDLVASLVLAGSHAGLPHLADADPAVGTALAQAGALEPTARAEALRGLLYGSATDRGLVAEDEAVRSAHPTTPQGFANQLAGVSAWERLADLSRLSLPTLVVHGTEDKIVPLRAGQRLAEAIPGAQLVRVEGAGHALFTDATDVVAGVIVDFFDARVLAP